MNTTLWVYDSGFASVCGRLSPNLAYCFVPYFRWHLSDFGAELSFKINKEKIEIKNQELIQESQGGLVGVWW